MSDPVNEELTQTGDADAPSGLDLTHKLKSLRLPEQTTPGVDEYLKDRRKALLICRDNETRKWGRRWLEREGMNVAVADDPRRALYIAKNIDPHVIVMEAGFGQTNDVPLIAALTRSKDIGAPVIALSSSSKDLLLALEAKVYDVARKPYEWKLIGRRAAAAAQLREMEQDLTQTRTALNEALEIADAARLSLRSQQSFEQVTGLPNKRKFVNLLTRGMSAVDRESSVLAVFVIGFNRFRLVIEAMGQENADKVLTQIGKRLSGCISNVDLFQAQAQGLKTSAAANIDVARFAVMLTCTGDEDELASMQQELVTQLSRPVNVAGQTVYLSACVGVALYPQDAPDADSLLQRADNAMRDAQSRGGGFKFYCPETDAAAARKLKLEHMLHEALNGGELSVAYQPIISMASGRLSGAESLLRWTQPDGSSISPAEFVPIAEESGLMSRVGEFVLDAACRQQRAWLDGGIKVPSMCVNVSKVQLMHGEFVTMVRRMLERHDLKPHQLELELSERGVLSGNVDLMAQLHELKTLGVRLSVDDFGTGDSAIAYLRELPVDVLKIDRSYISGLPENQKDKAIVSAMIAMGHSLGLHIVAEGIETRGQFQALRALKCDAVQGFFLSRAVDEQAFRQFLKART